MYMVVSSDEQKCFSIDQPRDTPVSFHHEILDHDDVVDFTLYYGKSAVKELSIVSKELRGASGVTDYMTDNDGEYTICLQKHTSTSTGSSSSSGGSSGSSDKNGDKDSDKKTEKTKAAASLPTRLKLKINYGFSDAHYSTLLQDQNFDAVNMEVRKLNDMMDLAINEADYQKHKEVEYHAETESMNAAALWWPVCQIGILIVIGVFQVQHLKHFFKTNKLI